MNHIVNHIKNRFIRKKFIKGISLLSLIIFFMLSCYYDSDEFMYAGYSIQCDTVNVSYSGSVEPIIEVYCLTCHSNSRYKSKGDGIRLESYEDLIIYAKTGVLSGAINHEANFAKMPKDANKLDDCKIATIEKWLRQNYPNN